MEIYEGFEGHTKNVLVAFEPEEIRKLFSFMTFGYGEHKDFRNMGTDYKGRDKVFQMIKKLNEALQSSKNKGDS